MNSTIDEYIEKVIEPSDQRKAKESSSVLCSAATGNPVVIVSEQFEAHTGYHPSEVIGQNLSFLQGINTEPEAVNKFRELIATGTAGVVRITNYRADGTEFIHECDFRPVRDHQDHVTHFVAVQKLVI